jgi:hypothetical protein
MPRASRGHDSPSRKGRAEEFATSKGYLNLNEFGSAMPTFANDLMAVHCTGETDMATLGP